MPRRRTPRRPMRPRAALRIFSSVDPGSGTGVLAGPSKVPSDCRVRVTRYRLDSFRFICLITSRSSGPPLPLSPTGEVEMGWRLTGRRGGRAIGAALAICVAGGTALVLGAPANAATSPTYYVSLGDSYAA